MDSQELVKEISERTGRSVRLVVLSYLQRGGSPTLQDRMLATRCGDKAIGLVDGKVLGFNLKEALAETQEFDRHLYEYVDVLSR